MARRAAAAAFATGIGAVAVIVLLQVFVAPAWPWWVDELSGRPELEAAVAIGGLVLASALGWLAVTPDHPRFVDLDETTHGVSVRLERALLERLAEIEAHQIVGISSARARASKRRGALHVVCDVQSNGVRSSKEAGAEVADRIGQALTMHTEIAVEGVQVNVRAAPGAGTHASMALIEGP